MAQNNHNWTFKSIGGSSRIDISTGEDIKHLGELDQKLWTVLSCPTTGLEFDQKTLEIIDTDKDGKIRVGEIVATAEYLTSVVKDADLLLEGKDSIRIDQFNQDNESGKRLYSSARQILDNLGIEKEEISASDTSDSAAIFAKTKFNGDGVIIPASSDDEAIQAVIVDAVNVTGGTLDRSGVQGVTADQIESLYADCADYSAWMKSGDAPGVLPFGDNTASALSAVETVKDKVDDYFIRCKLAAFDSESTSALDVQVSKISEISANNLTACSGEIASYPLARVTGSAELPLDGINPAWQAAFDTVRTLVLDVEYKGAKSITEEQWKAVLSKFDAYKAWKGAEKGSAVAALGIERVNAILAADAKSALLDLVAQDKALESEADSINDVDRFLTLFKNFYSLLRNYVTFDDFYCKDTKAVFQAGELYIDQRSLDLCIRVTDMGKHGDMAGLSGMYIIYCKCVSKSNGKSMDIAAVLTDGDVDNLRVGMNAVFYDRDGVDYDATVTKIVDNPVSVRQAFWAPYKKLSRTITERINKSVEEKNSKVEATLTEKANTTKIPTTKEELEASKAKDTAATPIAGFDIAKFAGIFAAIGMGLGMIGSAVMKIIDPWYNVIILLIVLVVFVSGPSMFIAWQKLRRRNLAPVLNANGWAINARILVNIGFGASLTSLAKFPAIELVDPRAARRRGWRRFRNSVLVLLLLAAICAGAYYFLVLSAC